MTEITEESAPVENFEEEDFENLKPAKNLFAVQNDTAELDLDFKSSLQKFGLQQHYIDRFDSDQVRNIHQYFPYLHCRICMKIVLMKRH